MRFRHILTGACPLLLALALQAQSYHVSAQWPIGGDGGWDYLLDDGAAHRLYVTHGTRVEVLDTETGKTVGAITGLGGTHGVTLNPDGKTGYISDGAGNAIVVFDRRTLEIEKKVPAGTNPDGITFDPVTHTVWAFNGRSKDVSVMDAKSNQIVATIPLPGKPEFPQADAKGNVFVNIEDQGVMVKLSGKTRTIVSSWPLTGCESPSGLAIDQKHSRLYSVCGDKNMTISDYKAGKVIGHASIGEHPDAAAYDPDKRLAFSSNGDGTLSVVDTSKDTFPTVQSVTTRRGARTMTYDPRSGRAFLAVAELGPAPEPTAEMPHPRPSILPGTFMILVVSR